MFQTKQERAAEAKRRIDELTEWFKDRPLPAGIVQVGKGVFVDNGAKFVETCLARLNENKITSTVLHAAFWILNDYKNAIERINEGGGAAKPGVSPEKVSSEGGGQIQQQQRKGGRGIGNK